MTDRQREVLDWISDFTAANGFPPTLREIGGALGITSTNAVNDHLKALERDGHISRSRKIARSIQVLGDDGCCPTCQRAWEPQP